ncbi:MAG: histone deacetylase [Bacteroidia bacterium]|nr:histone deacetylase [Bacteroidia bacterium]
MEKIPLVFSPGYDMSLLGIEKLHPFDSTKYGKVYRFLLEHKLFQPGETHEPEEVTHEFLLQIHGEMYLESLKKSAKIAQIAEVDFLKNVPAFLLDRFFLKPMRLATGGTVLGAELALKHGWAVNLGGGFHHAKATLSSGFCFYADIPLAAYELLKHHPEVKKIMVVDLDAHQGNGFEDIFGEDPRIVTFDVYNGQIYPLDYEARRFIKYNYPVKPKMADPEYLDLLAQELPKAIDREKPELVIYNAGSDIYKGDPLGGFDISAVGILRRDQFVFGEAVKRKIPLLMLLSGGYHPASWEIIGSAILASLKKWKLA